MPTYFSKIHYISFAGWGSTKYKGQNSEILQKATVSIADQTLCENAFSKLKITVRFLNLISFLLYQHLELLFTLQNLQIFYL